MTDATERLLEEIRQLKSRVSALELQAQPIVMSGGIPTAPLNFHVGGDLTVADDVAITQALSAGHNVAFDMALTVGNNIFGGGYLILGGIADGASQPKFRMANVTVANGATAQLLPGLNSVYGMVFINSGSDGSSAIFFCRGGANVTQEVADPTGHFTAVAGTASATNVYYSAGNSRYEIQNNRGASRIYEIYYFSR